MIRLILAAVILTALSILLCVMALGVIHDAPPQPNIQLVRIIIIMCIHGGFIIYMWGSIYYKFKKLRNN